MTTKRCGGGSRPPFFNISVTRRLRVVMTLLTAGMVISACGPEPTPRPVDLPGSAIPDITPTALAGRDVSLRYVLLPNTDDAVPDMELIQSASQVIQLTDATAELPPYDVAVMYGLEDGWTVSAYTPTVSLVVNATNPLFENPSVVSILHRSIDAQVIVQQLLINGTQAMPTVAEESNLLRTSLANLGYPDGVVISLGIGYIPGAAIVIDQFKAANLEVQSRLLYTNEIREALAAGTLQAALVFWTMPIERYGWVQRYGADNVVDLYSVPISYKVDPNWSISLTPNGFPLVMSTRAGSGFTTVELITSVSGG